MPGGVGGWTGDIRAGVVDDTGIGCGDGVAVSLTERPDFHQVELTPPFAPTPPIASERRGGRVPYFRSFIIFWAIRNPVFDTFKSPEKGAPNSRTR